jgi:hypothetical protein
VLTTAMPYAKGPVPLVVRDGHVLALPIISASGGRAD